MASHCASRPTFGYQAVPWTRQPLTLTQPRVGDARPKIGESTHAAPHRIVHVHTCEMELSNPAKERLQGASELHEAHHTCLVHRRSHNAARKIAQLSRPG